MVVGSSPVQLANAAMQAQAGHQVEVVEALATLGGAWTTTEFDGWSRVETACHLLEPIAEVYDFLQSGLGIDLDPMDPPPRTWLNARLSVPYGSRRAAAWSAAGAGARGVVSTAHAPRGARSAQLGRSAQALRHYLGMSIQRDPGPFRYFSGGVAGAMDRLRHLLDDRAVPVSLNAAVTRLRLSEAGAVVTIDGQDQAVDRVVLSSGVRNLVVDHEGVRHTIAGSGGRHFHLLLAVRSGLARPLSYHHFTRNNLIRRITDVTHAAVPGPSANPGDRLILVNLKSQRTAQPQPPPPVERVLEFLVARPILEPDAHIGATKWVTFESSDATDQLLGLVKDRVARIVFTPTFGDLTGALSRLPLRNGPVRVSRS